MSSVLHSVYKTCTWRIIAIMVTMSIGYMITGNIKVSLVLGAGDTAIKSVLYFIHERIWERI